MPKKMLIKEFESLVDCSTEELPLQRFLEAHPEILISTFYQGAHYPEVFPQFKLADERTPDFVMIAHRSGPLWDVDLIEIEPAILKDKLFNADRQSTGRLRIAEGQITDWQEWMSRYTDFFIRRAVEIIKQGHVWDKSPFFTAATGGDVSIMVWYRIVIGRRSDFDSWGEKYRKTKWIASGNKLEIVPWDRLLDKAREILARS